VPEPISPKAKGLRLELQIYLFAGLLIAVALGSFVYIGLTASRQADKLALESDKHLLRQALDDQIARVARDLHTLAVNDEAVRNISQTFNRTYVRDQLMPPLLAEGRADRVFLVNGAGRVVADASHGATRFIPYDLEPETGLSRLAEQSREKFGKEVFPLENGYAHIPAGRHSAEHDAAVALDHLNGIPALVAAMPVVPGEGAALLPSKTPYLLIAARHLDESFAADLNSTLSLREFRFLPGQQRRVRIVDFPLYSETGAFLGLFAWDVDRPGAKIWHRMLPMAGMFGLLLAAVAFFVARKIGRLTRSLEDSERRNRHSALHDPLTDLANRLQFSERLNFALENLADQPIAVIACDLDRFKAINDTHGHAAGDKVICTAADRLRRAVGEHGLVGRIGGDEFVILIEADLGTDGLARLCTQILGSVHVPIQIGAGIHADVGMSLGIARAPASGQTETELMKAADLALYAAKSSGRDTFVFAEQLPVETLQKSAGS